jgi:hypothetical protein
LGVTGALSGENGLVRSRLLRNRVSQEGGEAKNIRQLSYPRLEPEFKNEPMMLLLNGDGLALLLRIVSR